MSTICSNDRIRETDLSTSTQLSEILQTFDSEVARLPADGLQIKCSNSGCNWQGTYFDKYRHLRKCPHSYISCKWCGLNIKRADLCTHLNDVCWRLKGVYFQSQEISETREVHLNESLHGLEPKDDTKECLHEREVTEPEDHMEKSFQKWDKTVPPDHLAVGFLQGQEMAEPNALLKGNCQWQESDGQQTFPQETSNSRSQQCRSGPGDDCLKASHHLKEKQRQKVA